MVLNLLFSHTQQGGNLYFGERVLNTRNGFGIQVFLDFSIYCGNWTKDHANGHGILFHSSGLIIEGTFVYNEISEGVIKYPNGTTFKGFFTTRSQIKSQNDDQKITSNGIFFLQNKILKGTWENGIMKNGTLTVKELDGSFDENQNKQEFKIDFACQKSNYKKKISQTNDFFAYYNKKGLIIDNKRRSIEEGNITETHKFGVFFEYSGPFVYSEHVYDLSGKKAIIKQQVNLLEGYEINEDVDKQNKVDIQTISLTSGIQVFLNRAQRTQSIQVPIFEIDNYQEIVKQDFNPKRWLTKGLAIGKGTYFYKNSSGKIEASDLECLCATGKLQKDIVIKKTNWQKIVPLLFKKHSHLKYLLDSFTLFYFSSKYDLWQDFLKYNVSGKPNLNDIPSYQNANESLSLKDTSFGFLQNSILDELNTSYISHFSFSNPKKSLSKDLFDGISRAQVENTDDIHSIIESEFETKPREFDQKRTYDRKDYTSVCINNENENPKDIGNANLNVVYPIINLFAFLFPKKIKEDIKSSTLEIKMTRDTGIDPIDWLDSLEFSRKKTLSVELKVIGTILNGEKTGFCMVFYSDGSFFRGNFVNDKRTGSGILKDTKGDLYYGEFNLDQPVGCFLKVDKNGRHVMCKLVNNIFIEIQKKVIDGYDVNGIINSYGQITGKGILRYGNFEIHSQFVCDKIDLKSKSGLLNHESNTFTMGVLKINKNREGIFITESQQCFRVKLKSKVIKDMNLFLMDNLVQ